MKDPHIPRLMDVVLPPMGRIHLRWKGHVMSSRLGKSRGLGLLTLTPAVSPAKLSIPRSVSKASMTWSIGGGVVQKSWTSRPPSGLLIEPLGIMSNFAPTPPYGVRRTTVLPCPVACPSGSWAQEMWSTWTFQAMHGARSLRHGSNPYGKNFEMRIRTKPLALRNPRRTETTATVASSRAWTTTFSSGARSATGR